MKNTFPGYNKKTKAEIKKIWADGLICFDANVLLNLYKYSNETLQALLELIEKFKDKIYLPYQAALEYNRNRYNVIAAQGEVCEKFIAEILKIQEDIKPTRKPPFLSDPVQASLNRVFEKVTGELKDSKTKYDSFLQIDPIYERIAMIFESRITKGFDDKELSGIFKEGKERYNNKIPPGF